MQTRRKFAVYTIIIALSLATILLINYKDKIKQILIPFLVATLIAYILRPIVIKLNAKKIPTSLSILLIYFAILMLTTISIIFVIPELINNSKELINTLPEMALKYQNYCNKSLSLIRAGNWPTEIENALLKELQNIIYFMENTILNTLKNSISSVIKTVTVALDIILSMIIAYYFIKDAELFKESLLSLAPRKWRNWVTETSRQINKVLEHFIQGQLLTALIVGTMETAILFFINIKYPLVLGFIGGIANIIPYFGPIIGAIPAIGIALIDSPIKALWTAVAFIIIQQIDNAFISPHIIEGKLGIHPVTTILAVLIGGEFFGITGMFVSVPLIAILKIIFKRTIDAIV